MNEVAPQSLMVEWTSLINKQFKYIARSLMITDEQAWELFLKQRTARELDRDFLSKLKSKADLKAVLFGQLVLPIDVVIVRLRMKGHCDILPVLAEMSEEALLPELTAITNKILAIALESV